MTEQYSFQEIEDLRAEIDRLRAENELLRDTKGCTILDQQEEIERLNNGYVVERAARSEAEAEIERLRADKDVRRSQERNTSYEKSIAELEAINAELLAVLRYVREQVDRNAHGRTKGLAAIDAAIAKVEGA